jgi:AcrR family transcriptional regulator
MKTTGKSKPAPGATEQRVRDAAIRLFAERGFAATGIREIATAAGIVPSVLYHYFANKDELLLSIMRRGIETSVAVARRATDGIDAPAARLSTLAQVHVAMQGVSALGATVADNEMRSLHGEGRDEILRLRDEYEGLWRDCLDAGVEQGVFHVDDVALTRLALIEMCNGPARWYRAEGEQRLDHIAVVYADLALRAVDARDGEKPLRTADLELPAAATIVELVSTTFAAAAEPDS